MKVKAVIDFPEYERLKNMGLDLGCKNTDIKLVVQNEKMAEGELAASIFNESVDATAADDGEKQVSAVEKNSIEEKSTEPDDGDNDDDGGEKQNSSFQNLSTLAPPAYRDRTSKLLEALNLSGYQGGTFALDGQTYDYNSLVAILNKLYGRGGKKSLTKNSPAQEAKLDAFLSSISARKGLKKLVKNKRLFKKGENSEHWWRFV